MFKLGDVEILRVEESHGPGFQPNQLLPDWSAEAIAPHKSWLVPDYYDDVKDRLISSVHSWVVKTRHHTILIDTCVGNHKHRPEQPRFHMLERPYMTNLAAAGIRPEDVDFVLCTHLHVDHVGWNTMLEGGKWVPTFPKAKYLIGKQEYAHWKQEGDPEQQAILGDSVQPIFDAGLATLVEMNHRISNEIRLTPTPGHTPGHVSVLIESKRQRAMITGDMLHHPCQFGHPEWSPSFDSDPIAGASMRRVVMETVAGDDILVIGTHFAAPTAGHVKRDGAAFRFDV